MPQKIPQQEKDRLPRIKTKKGRRASLKRKSKNIETDHSRFEKSGRKKVTGRAEKEGRRGKMGEKGQLERLIDAAGLDSQRKKYGRRSGFLQKNCEATGVQQPYLRLRSTSSNPSELLSSAAGSDGEARVHIGMNKWGGRARQRAEVK